MTSNKKYNIKFYGRDGELISTMKPSHRSGDISFSGLVNSGMGELNIQLNLPFDAYSATVDYVKNMNFVRVYQYDENNLNGRLIFTGYNQRYVPELQKNQDFVTLRFLGLASLMRQKLFGTAPNFTKDYETTPTDVGQIARDIIDQINSDVGDNYDWITYETSGADQTAFLTGSTSSLKFIDTEMFDSMEACRNVAGGDWYWHIDGTGKFHFRQKASSAEHTFQVGKNVQAMEIDTHVADIANDVTIEWDNGGSSGRTNLTDATSIATYGRFTPKVVIESQIKSSADATARAQTELDKYKNPRISVGISVTSDYDIESIRVGQTCRVIGMKTTADDLSNNMQIVSVKYKPDTITLELEDVQSLGKSLAAL